MQKCRAEVERVGHGCQGVDENTAITRIVERHVRSGVNGSANKYKTWALELEETRGWRIEGQGEDGHDVMARPVLIDVR